MALRKPIKKRINAAEQFNRDKRTTGTRSWAHLSKIVTKQSKRVFLVLYPRKMWASHSVLFYLFIKTDIKYTIFNISFPKRYSNDIVLKLIPHGN
jgi:hypothetical protein